MIVMETNLKWTREVTYMVLRVNGDICQVLKFEEGTWATTMDASRAHYGEYGVLVIHEHKYCGINV